jgi:hypothetical protein
MNKSDNLTLYKFKSKSSSLLNPLGSTPCEVTYLNFLLLGWSYQKRGQQKYEFKYLIIYYIFSIKIVYMLFD